VTGETFRRWVNGWCPCCGIDDMDWWPDTPPETIGEGVQICGRCSENEHMNDPRFRDAMLEAIASQSEEPIDRLLGR
jgi:hypothetical protein